MHDVYDSLLDEELQKEEVAAADFGAEIPGDQRHGFKSDGEQLNKQSRANLKKYGIKLVYAGKNSEYLKEMLKITINKKDFRIS